MTCKALLSAARWRLETSFLIKKFCKICFILHLACYGLALLPSIICIQSLTTASGSPLFGSVVRALDFYPGRPGLHPIIGGKFFSYASFLCYDFHVKRHNSLPCLSYNFKSISLPADVSKNCQMSGKQWRPWSDAAFWGIWSGSTMFA